MKIHLSNGYVWLSKIQRQFLTFAAAFPTSPDSLNHWYVSVQEIAFRHIHMVGHWAPGEANCCTAAKFQVVQGLPVPWQQPVLSWCSRGAVCLVSWGDAKAAFLWQLPVLITSWSVMKLRVSAQACCRGSTEFCSADNPRWQSCLWPQQAE